MTSCNQLEKITCHIYKICYKIIVKRLETQHQLNKYIKVHVILHQFILFHLTMKRRLSFVFIICVALYLFGQVLFLYLSFGLIYIYLGNFCSTFNGPRIWRDQILLEVDSNFFQGGQEHFQDDPQPMLISNLFSFRA